MGMLKKAASGVLWLRTDTVALLPCSRYEYAPLVKRAAALPVEGRVLAHLGWAGQTTNFFEHSLPLTMWALLERLLAIDVNYSTAPVCQYRYLHVCKSLDAWSCPV